MPKTIFIGTDNSGISITWIPSAQRVDIGGWYDGMVGIEGEELSLSEFFKRVGITLKDCEKAFREAKE